MKKLKLLYLGVMLLFIIACRVTFITGYDEIIDQTITSMKKDFNLHFIKLSRTLMDDDPNNQKFENFLEYYDNLEATIITLRDRAKFLTGKSEIVKKQVTNVDSVMHTFIALHKKGMKDSRDDDRRDIRNNINSTLDAVTALQEALKSTGKTE